MCSDAGGRTSPAEGGIAWTIALGVVNGVGVFPNAVGLDGTVYVTRPAGSLYAVSRTGTLKRTFSPPGGLGLANLAIATDCTTPRGCESTIYAFRFWGVLYALNSDGSVKWMYGALQRDCGGCTITFSPAIGANVTIYGGVSYSEGGGALFALSSGGTLLWSSSLYNGTPAVDPNSGMIYVQSDDLNHLYALNSNGFLQWKVDVSSSFTLPAIGSDGTVYVGTYGFGLWAINPNGTIKWQVSPGGASYFLAPPIIGGDGTIYIATNSVSLLAINPDSTLKWSTKLCSGAGGDPGVDEPVIALDGTIYMILQDGPNGPCPLEAFH